MNDPTFGTGKQDGFETLLTIAEVAKALQVSEVTVRRIIAKKELVTVRVGERHVRISPSALREYVAAQAQGSMPVRAEPKTSSKPARLGPIKTFEGKVGDLPWKVLEADALQGLRSLKDETVDCIVTSPPYYWQRDYGYDGQIGHEATIDGFVESLRDVFSEARRVLKLTGTFFLNIGDTYYSAKGKPHGQDLKNAGRQMARTKLRAVDGPGLGLPRKSLIGIPWRVALALQQDGWTLRSDIIWDRPGSLGEPTAKDRPWRRYEHVFMFSRAPRYYFDRTGLSGSEDIWSFPARPDNPIAHFAPYPRELVSRCLSIGCPPGGTVLDPFVGSGTTMVAALEAGRSAVGIDLSPDYCTHVLKWITAAKSGQRSRARSRKGS
ncbi:DNA methyltransferase [Mesorhizobium jarvisii]|uniref:DNA methyltransferase n=1 Tax=Mesorhizobium jarvisii TaxID=1777867 RepID=UPI001F0B5135|nr:DNA methyltransferase [Mesorhizobium jarvisii]MCH4561025.1 excisionase family DNA-binding protein [Mesorhizobium jarvisii]